MAKLLGKADPTLIAASYRAAMANVPKDMSKIYERLSKSHAATMKSIGSSWVKGITATAQIGQGLRKMAQKKKSSLVTPHKNYSNFQASPPGIAGKQTVIDPADKEMKIPGASEQSQYQMGGGFGQKTAPTYEDPDTSIELKDDKRKFVTKPIKEYTYTDINNNTEIVKPKNVEDHLKEIRKEFVSLGFRRDRDAINPATGKKWTKEERKTRREELNIKKDKLKASVVEFQAYSSVMKEQLAADNVNIAASDPVKMQFSKALMSDGKPLEDGSRAIMGFSDEGNMTFTYVDRYGRPIMNKDGSQMSIQQNDIEDLLILKSPERGNYDLVGSKEVHLAAGKAGLAFSGTEIASFVENNVTDENTFRDLSNYLGPNTTQTLTSALNGVKYVGGEPVIGTTEMSTAIFGELNKLGNLETWDVAGGADGATDGKITAADFTSPENYNKLKDYILSGKDITLSKKILETHLKNEAKAIHAQGLAQFEAANAVNPTDIVTLDGKIIKNYQLGPDRDGFIFNVATNKSVFKGHKYQSGAMTFDDEAALAKIGKNKKFVDAFQNIYEPATGNIRIGKTKETAKVSGYYVIDSTTGERVKDDEGKDLFVAQSDAARYIGGEVAVRNIEKSNEQAGNMPTDDL